MRQLFIFYLLGIYILFQFSWWAYLLIDLDDEVYSHKIENVKLKSLPPAEMQKEISILEKKIQKRRVMVLSEGGVFLLLIFWGSILALRSIRKEVALAQQQKNFLLSITHEFKSPLASIKLYLQTLQKHDLDKEKEKAFITSAIADSERLDNLVENTLLANVMNKSAYAFIKEEMNFSAFIRLLVQKYQSVPGHNKIETRIEDNIFFTGDKNSLNVMLQNLLENATKYSSKDTPIAVELQKKGNEIKLFVKDHGIGIQDKEKKKIFDKFYRIGNEETRQTKGTGLGLFIVKYIVEGHDGSIHALDNTPNGSIFCVQFKS